MSAGAKPDLTIRLNMDLAEALKKLAKLDEMLEKTDDKTKQNASNFKSWVDAAQGLTGVSSGLGMVKQAFDAIRDSAESAMDYTKDVAKEFTQIQEALRIVASFKGVKDTDQFALDTVKKGAVAGQTARQWAAFEKEFNGYAGQFIGDEEGKKIGKTQAEELAQRAAAYMQARGMDDPSQGASVFGEILQQAKGGESNDELMKRFGQSFAVLEAAKGDPGQLLGQMGQVTAGGVDLQTASKLMRVMAQRAPGEAGTYSRGALRGLRDLEMNGEGGELGITEDMSIFQKLEQISNKADQSGMPLNKFLSQFKALQEERASGGIEAAINFGVKGGMFNLADKEAAAVTGTTDIEAVTAFKNDASGPGPDMYTRAREEAARVESGQRYKRAQSAMATARAELTEEKDEYGRNVFQQPRYLSRRLWSDEDLVKQRAVKDTLSDLPKTEQIKVTAGVARDMPNGTYLDSLQRLVELQEQRIKQADYHQEERNRSARPPLSAPPANPRTRW